MIHRDEHARRAPEPTTPSTRDPAREKAKGPPDRAKSEERIDEALDMTFPASDPPVWPAPRKDR